MTVQTEFEFSLPKGVIGKDEKLHKKGVMRLATAADEILPLKDPRVQANTAYMTIILFSRVITELGDMRADEIDPKVIESLFVSDLAYLRTFYEGINGNGASKISAMCPKCENKFDLDLGRPE